MAFKQHYDSNQVSCNQQVVEVKKKEYAFKFLIIGDYGVGKTAIVRRYSEGKFSSNYKITIGADFSLKRILWDGDTKVSLQLWDVAGHEKFGYMTRVYYKHAIGCAIVFDITRYTTYESVHKWLIDIREKVMLDDGRPLPIVVLANKSDINEMCISSDAINRYCRENDICAWFLTSAKDNINIDEGMNTLVREAVKLVNQTPIKPESQPKNTIRLQQNNNRDSGCCH